MSEITQKDVKDLYDDASPQKRLHLARKIGLELDVGQLSDTEHDLAIAICQQLAQDVEISVRHALAETIKASDAIPHDLALQLANDVIEVSLPILEFSQVLNDEDLKVIVEKGDTQRQLAITHRASISAEVSQSLVEAGSEQVVVSLLQNKEADLANKAYDEVLSRFQNNPSIHNSMAQRHSLPKHVIERMVDLVSTQLKAHLVTTHQMSAFLAERLVLESKEDAKRRLLADPLSKRDAEQLVQTLFEQEKLSTDLIFRSLEIGDRPFFEYAMAKRVNIPIDSARALIKDKGDKGFKALYFKARLPKKDFPSINFLVETEYHNKRQKPITDVKKTAAEPDTWLTETSKPKKKWRIF